MPIASPLVPHTAAGCLVAPNGLSLPLREVAITVDAHVDAVSITTTATFANSSTTPLEVSYVCPLPAGYAPTAAACVLAGRTVIAELVARRQAIEAYDDAVAEGRTAAIATQIGAELFSFTIGNIAVDEIASISVTMVGIADVDDGQATVRIPLHVGERFQPADTFSVQPARRNHAGRDEPVAAVTVIAHDVNATIATHDATYATTGGVTTAHVVAGLDGDLVIRWPARTDWVARLTDDGPLRWLTVSATGARVTDRAARDIVVLIDRSGSMDGWQMGAACDVAASIVNRLDARDRVCVLAFDNELSMPDGVSGFGSADAARRRVVNDWLRGLTARGGTELTRALMTASGLVAQSTAATIVVITDAEIGDEARCVAAVGMCAADVVTVGVGSSVNGGLLHAMSAASGGWYTTIESADRLADAVGDIAARVAGPATAIRAVRLVGAASDVVWSDRLPSLYAGHQTVMRAQLTGRPTAVVVSGPGFEQTVEIEGGVAPTARALWATGRVAALLREPDREQDALAVALFGGVLCPLTAFIAVDSSGRQLDDPPVRVDVGHLDTDPFSSQLMSARGGAVAPSPSSASASAPSMRPMPSMPMPRRRLFTSGAERLLRHATSEPSPSQLATFGSLCALIAAYEGSPVPTAGDRTALLGAWAELAVDHLGGRNGADAKQLAQLIAAATVDTGDAAWRALLTWAVAISRGGNASC